MFVSKPCSSVCINLQHEAIENHKFYIGYISSFPRGKLAETRSVQMLDWNIWNMTVIVLSLFVFANILYISAEIREAKWRKTFINSGVNNAIVGASEPSKSVMICSATCSKSSQYKTFYYSSALKECYCNTQLDGTANPTNVNTGLTYGTDVHVEVLYVNYCFCKSLNCLC